MFKILDFVQWIAIVISARTNSRVHYTLASLWLWKVQPVWSASTATHCAHSVVTSKGVSMHTLGVDLAVKEACNSWLHLRFPFPLPFPLLLGPLWPCVLQLGWGMEVVSWASSKKKKDEPLFLPGISKTRTQWHPWDRVTHCWLRGKHEVYDPKANEPSRRLLAESSSFEAWRKL